MRNELKPKVVRERVMH